MNGGRGAPLTIAVDDAKTLVIIARIAHRRDVYRR
jgi:mRNA-degrading endonuclease RelE of RelBE toxin-antitoxin system